MVVVSFWTFVLLVLPISNVNREPLEVDTMVWYFDFAWDFLSDMRSWLKGTIKSEVFCRVTLYDFGLTNMLSLVGKQQYWERKYRSDTLFCSDTSHFQILWYSKLFSAPRFTLGSSSIMQIRHNCYPFPRTHVKHLFCRTKLPNSFYCISSYASLTVRKIYFIVCYKSWEKRIRFPVHDSCLILGLAWAQHHFCPHWTATIRYILKFIDWGSEFRSLVQRIFDL